VSSALPKRADSKADITLKGWTKLLWHLGYCVLMSSYLDVMYLDLCASKPARIRQDERANVPAETRMRFIGIALWSKIASGKRIGPPGTTQSRTLNGMGDQTTGH